MNQREWVTLLLGSLLLQIDRWKWIANASLASFVQCVHFWIRLNISTVSSSSSSSLRNRIGLLGYSFSQHAMSIIMRKKRTNRRTGQKYCLGSVSNETVGTGIEKKIEKSRGWTNKLNIISIKKCLEMLSISKHQMKKKKTRSPRLKHSIHLTANLEALRAHG